MATKWIHKEAWWANYDSDNANLMNANFTEWLNEQCEDGWEVLKISREFQSSTHHTWVVFRKQV